MPFTAAELEDMRRADEEIEREFRLTPEDLAESKELDRQAKMEEMLPEKRKVREYQRAYYEATREKVLESQRAYREANREKVLESQRAYYEANREKVRESQRWIRDERTKRGYTQRELAQRIGSSQPSIAMLESGRMTLAAFHKAAELFQFLGAQT